jgi:hypothetical protein
MNVQIIPKPLSMVSLPFPADLKREHGETVDLQEQFTGPVPLRRERPAAEILAERLAESVPDSPFPVFVP